MKHFRLTSALILSGFLGGGSMALADTDPKLPCHSSYDEGTDILELPCVELTPSEIYGRATLKSVSPKEDGGPFTFEVVGWTPDLKGNLGSTQMPAWVITAYQKLFPDNTAGYTAQSLYDALALHNVFAGQDAVQQVYNLAGFLANADHESAGFTAMTEYGNYNPGMSNNWKTDGKGVFSGSYPGCQAPYGGTGTTCYYGRGGLQLSHDYNYKIYDTGNGAFADPDIILGTGEPDYTNNLLFDSAVWFWSDDSKGLQTLRPVDGFKAASSTYAVSDPFGQSIRVINGGIECAPKAHATGITERNARIALFISYLPTIAQEAKVQLIPGYSTAADGTIGVACSVSSVPIPSNSICGTTAGQGGWNSTFCNMPCDGTAKACTDPTGQGQAMSCYTPPAGKC